MKPQLLRLSVAISLLTIIHTTALQAQITMGLPTATTYYNTVPVSYVTSTAPSSIKMIFTYLSGVEATPGANWVMTLSSTTTSGSFSFSPATITSNLKFSSIVPDSALPDGSWGVQMQYVSSTNGLTYNSKKVILSISSHTLKPLLIAPVLSGSSTNPLAISYNLVGSPSLSANSKPEIIFTNSSFSDTLKLSTNKVVNFTMNSDSVHVNNTYISSFNHDTIPDGLYNVILGYADIANHPYAYDTITNFLLQTVTPAAILTSPSTTSANTIPVAFNLPSAPLGGSVRLQFAGTDTLNVVLATTDSGNHSFNLNAGALASDTNIVSTNRSYLPMGVYNVTLSYQDFLGNPAQSTTINNFSFQGVLAVSLQSFSAKLSGNTTLLNWTTASETGNKGFEIERQINDNWQTIGFVSGNGNSNSTHQYNFSDNGLATEGAIYYRLKQLDINGNSSYSDIVSVKYTGNTQALLLKNYPDPFSAYTTISYSLPANGPVTMTVYNTSGKLLSTLINETKAAGTYSVKWDTQHLPAGIYYYKIVAASFSAVKKMIRIN